VPERILVAVAWPYANGSLHLGHIAGCYLPADVFARYHRLRGNQVLMVSGSDQHGTPITIRAEREGTSPQQVVDKYHAEFLRSWERMGISFDLFTTTGTENHRKVVHDLFLDLYSKGHIYKGTMLQPRCPSCRRFLPDRYVEGGCPRCGNPGARGDQCERCGRTLNPEELVEPRCRTCGTSPEFANSEHFFLRLSAFQRPLLEWVRRQEHWRPNVLNFTLSYLEDGLKDRAITRDIAWGVPVPLEGYEDKRIYVWFEAVTGYLSASMEWAQRHGRPEEWKQYWHEPASRAYYFIGKDNIPFHSIVWPAMLMGRGGLNLPYDVPANEFLSLEDRKFSTSGNWAVWLPDYLERYDPDPLRYYLSINMPETGDSDFSWNAFVHRNNDELVATYGNLVNRVLTLAYRNFDRAIPSPGDLDDASRRMLSRGSDVLDAVGASLGACRFRMAIGQAMGLAQEANRYLDAKAPWKTLKKDRAATATVLWVALSVIGCLKVVLYPFLPFSSRRLHEMMGFRQEMERVGWNWQGTTDYLPPGQPLGEPRPLYTKLDEAVVQEEAARLKVEAD
jgi:methionyl-tRNA synthetase